MQPAWLKFIKLKPWLRMPWSFFQIVLFTLNKTLKICVPFLKIVFVTTLTSSFSATHMRRTNGEILKPTNKAILILLLIPENSSFKQQNTPTCHNFCGKQIIPQMSNSRIPLIAWLDKSKFGYCTRQLFIGYVWNITSSPACALKVHYILHDSWTHDYIAWSCKAGISLLLNICIYTFPLDVREGQQFTGAFQGSSCFCFNS